jgi:SNF2 family DNA or RNA helicase
MLDLVDHALQAHGFKFRQPDGQTTLESSGRAIKHFNEDAEYTVMLASITSCGEGFVSKPASIQCWNISWLIVIQR